MTLKNLPKSGTLEIENFINPEANTALEGSIVPEISTVLNVKPKVLEKLLIF